MEYRVTLNGPTGTQDHVASGEVTKLNAIHFPVCSGLWNVYVEAYYEGNLYAIGSSAVNAKYGEDNQCVIIMNVPTYLSPAQPAQDIPTYEIKILTEGSGTATANPNPAAAGTIVTLTATPNAGHVFKEWIVNTGGVTIENLTANPATFTMPASNDEVIKAVFIPFPIEVPGSTVTYNGSGQTATIIFYGGDTSVTVNNGDYTAEAGTFTVEYSDSTGKVLASDPVNAGTYGIYITTTGGTVYPAITASVGTFTINPKALTIVIATHTKTYDGTTEATGVTGSFDGLISGSSLLFDTVTAAYTSANAGTTSITITAVTLSGSDAGNYTVDVPVTLTVAGITKANGAAVGTPAVASSTPNSIMVNAVSLQTATGQSVEYAYNQSGLTDAGTLAGLTWTVYATPTITFSGLTAGETYYVYARSASNTNYNEGTPSVSAGIQAENLLSNPMAFTDATVTKTYGDAAFTNTLSTPGSGLSATTYLSSNTAVATVDSSSGQVTITGAGSAIITATKASDGTYGTGTASFTLTVNPKSVTITGVTAENRYYNANTNATFNAASATIVGNIDGDSLVIDTTSASASFSDKNAGSAKTVTFSGFALGGSKAANYTLAAQPANATANIMPYGITATISATNRAYNGTTTVALTGNLNGIFGGDTVTIDAATMTGTIANANVEDDKAVSSINIGLTGTDAGNYNLTQPTGVTVNITAKALTVNVATHTKVYDGTTAATGVIVTLSSGIETVDTGYVSVGAVTAAYTNANAGTTTLNITAVALTGTAADNYTVSVPASMFVVGITQADGVAPPAPTMYSRTSTSITLTAVSVSTTQVINYAMNTTNTVPTTGWQTTTLFSGLEPSTTYYFFARAVGNTNYTEKTTAGAAIATDELQPGTFIANSPETWETAVAEITSGGEGDYTIIITGDFSIPGSTANTFGTENGINVTITGNKEISLSEDSTGNLLRIPSGQTVTINDTDLIGHSDNNSSLVYVSSSGTFIMDGTSSLSDNKGGNGGGVYVMGGTFTMNGGTISGNTANSGGGVLVSAGTDGSFIMNAGTISNNTANNNGGGVCVGMSAPGTFLMKGGTIYGDDGTVNANTATNGNALYVTASGSTAKYEDDTDIGGTATVPRNIDDTISVP